MTNDGSLLHFTIIFLMCDCLMRSSTGVFNHVTRIRIYYLKIVPFLNDHNIIIEGYQLQVHKQQKWGKRMAAEVTAVKQSILWVARYKNGLYDSFRKDNIETMIAWTNNILHSETVNAHKN